MSEEARYEIWVSDDAEYPGDMVLEEGPITDLKDAQTALAQLWAELEEGEHRKAIMIFDRTKPLKGEL